MILAKTPYLTANKVYFDLLNRVEVPLTALVLDWAYVRLDILEGSRSVWSGGVTFGDPTSLQASFFSSNVKRLRAFLSYTKFHKGFPHVARVGLGLPRIHTDHRGVSRVDFSHPKSEYPLALRNAKLRVSGMVSNSRSLSVPSLHNPLRANPEVRNRVYTIVSEITQTDGSYSISSAPGSYAWFTRTWSGVRTPGFSKLKPSQYPVNPHSVSIKEVYADGPLIEIKDQRPYGSKFVSLLIDKHTVHYSEPGEPSHLASARNKAIRKLIDKAELGIDANLAQDFAQLGQTVRLIGDNAHKIVKAARQTRKLNFSGAVDTLFAGRHRRFNGAGPSSTKSLASNWLELQYGWKPLLNDIYGSMKSLANLQVGSERFVQRVTQSATSEYSRRETYGSWDIQNTNAVGTRIIRTSTRCKFVLRFRISSPLKTFLAQTGFTNPVNLAWEILPFSFVADWFLPIGPYLETLSSWDGLEFLDGVQTQFTKERVASAISGQTDRQADHIVKQTTSDYAHEWIKLDRVKLTSFPSQTFPSFKNGLASVDHALNAVALIKSIFGR